MVTHRCNVRACFLIIVVSCVVFPVFRRDGATLHHHLGNTIRVNHGKASIKCASAPLIPPRPRGFQLRNAACRQPDNGRTKLFASACYAVTEKSPNGCCPMVEYAVCTPDDRPLTPRNGGGMAQQTCHSTKRGPASVLQCRMPRPPSATLCGYGSMRTGIKYAKLRKRVHQARRIAAKLGGCTRTSHAGCSKQTENPPVECPTAIRIADTTHRTGRWRVATIHGA